jgi:protein-S-isoprenylcysteine O-methyltransferase Ste14
VGTLAISLVFALIAAAIGAEAVTALGDAFVDPTSHAWLTAGYSLLKLAVAVAFTYFVLRRAPARRRTRDPVAYLACAAAIAPAVLRRPAESAPDALLVAGELVALVGCGWMLVAALALGRCFGVLPEARGLVTHGPYRLVRHPLYLGEFGAMGGLLLASPSARNLVVGGVFAGAQFTRMRLEERALTREFSAYAAYAERTPRIVPSLRGLRAVARASGRLQRRLVAARGDGPRSAESGTTLVEYAPIVGIVAVMAAAVLTPLGSGVADLIAPVVQGF